MLRLDFRRQKSLSWTSETTGKTVTLSLLRMRDAFHNYGGEEFGNSRIKDTQVKAFSISYTVQELELAKTVRKPRLQR